MEKMSRICTQSCFYSQTQKDVIILAGNSFYQKIMGKKAKPTSFNGIVKKNTEFIVLKIANRKKHINNTKAS